MELIEFILHLDTHLQTAIEHLGLGSYIILFLIIFAETGLVVIPFLPGDSLLFVAGSLAGAGMLDVRILIPSLIVAAIAGDTLNYWLGSRIGARVFTRQNAKLFKPSHLRHTQDFFAKHGGKTIIIARFLPIVRTFAPFVAGIGDMNYRTFLFYNVIGAFVWVISITVLGFFFGRIPLVKDNFEIVIVAIIALSIIPPVIEYLKHRRKSRAAAADAQNTTYQDVQETFEKVHLKD